MYDDKTNEEIFAETLIHIIENQMSIKRHLGIDRDYGDCYLDRKIINNLKTIK
jgi:hypothetical protein